MSDEINNKKCAQWMLDCMDWIDLPRVRRRIFMSEWINIKDIQPPELPYHSIYIVTMHSHLKNKVFVEPLHYIGGEWFTMVHEEPLDLEYEVTHWMPLPEPPK